MSAHVKPISPPACISALTRQIARFAPSETSMPHYDLILRGGQAVLPWGIEPLDIGVRDGRIAAMGSLRTSEATQEVDCRQLHVLPGLIDAHVHLREPGDPAVETIATGTRAAILGGLAAVFDMPNTAPSITDSAQLA
jgi:dihydroorotase